MTRRSLLYVADPMCSWCWGFRPVLARVRAELPADVRLEYVLGGLAPDSDEPMEPALRAYVQAAWRTVAETTGAHFDHRFWTECTPRRSTYPACRAVLAARAQDDAAGPALFDAIQRAYYLEARNPSDVGTLVAVFAELASEWTPRLDAERFARDLPGTGIERRLQADLARARALGASAFPSLVLERGDEHRLVTRGWADADTVRAALDRALAELPGLRV